MSIQRLNPRSTRRIERSIGEAVFRAWGHGGYQMSFVTPDHRHGWWDKKTGDTRWYGDDAAGHVSTCREIEWESDERFARVVKVGLDWVVEFRATDDVWRAVSTYPADLRDAAEGVVAALVHADSRSGRVSAAV